MLLSNDQKLTKLSQIIVAHTKYSAALETLRRASFAKSIKREGSCAVIL